MTLKEALQKVKLENPEEKRIIEGAIISLNNGVFEPKVLKELKVAFEKLAQKNQLSKLGMKFYMEISKPNFNLDSDLSSSITWF